MHLLNQQRPASQDSSNDLFVSVGKSVLVDSAHQITRVALGSGDIAEATAVSPSEIMVNGNGSGETTLNHLGDGRRPAILQREGWRQQCCVK